jgi:hypothetical protein
MEEKLDDKIGNFDKLGIAAHGRIRLSPEYDGIRSPIGSSRT